VLGRTADNLYWMARYIERVENTARLMGGINRVALLPVRASSLPSPWEAMLPPEDGRSEFLGKYDGITSANIITYMCLDLDNAASIRSGIRSARENVRAARHVLPTEAWESVNQTWLEIRGLDYPGLEEMGCHEFFEWVKERAHLFRGILYGTMRRGEAFMFWRLGTHLERADNTARLLAGRFAQIPSARRQTIGAMDYYQWGNLLRSVNAMKVYRDVYRGAFEPRRIAELLIFRQDMPRSLRACLDEIRVVLDELGAVGVAKAHAEVLHQQLVKGRLDHILRSGLANFLMEFLRQTSQLGQEVQKDFMMIR